MSDHELPEDLQNWPQEAHLLLGIDRNADERELKRAYTRLIRRYKPDHHPQQFARIRAAYEELKQRLEWRSAFESPQSGNVISLEQLLQLASESTEPSDPNLVEPSTNKEESVVEGHSDVDPVVAPDRSEQSQRQSVKTELDAAWESACDGNVAEAYRQLVALHERDRGNEDLCLRLYWLLRVAPDLDAQKHCSDWLVETLQHHQLRGDAWSLYHAELKRQPTLVDSPGNLRLRNTATLAHHRFEFLAARWRAAADLERWYLIESDLRDFRETVLDDAISVWGRMLFLVADLTVWSQHKVARTLFVQSGRELETFTELQFALSSDFARHDVLRDLAPSMSEPRESSLPEEIIAVLRETWLDPHYVCRPRLQSMLEGWVEHPSSALSMLDLLRKHHRQVFYLLMFKILECDVNIESRPAQEYKYSPVWRVVKSVVSGAHLNYGALRGNLLKFCVQQQITLTEVLDGLQRENVRPNLATIPTKLADDLPLKVVLHGIASFWS